MDNDALTHIESHFEKIKDDLEELNLSDKQLVTMFETLCDSDTEKMEKLVKALAVNRWVYYEALCASGMCCDQGEMYMRRYTAQVAHCIEAGDNIDKISSMTNKFVSELAEED
jgi:DNA-binding MurR/RpiR family transcriptional regulator